MKLLVFIVISCLLVVTAFSLYAFQRVKQSASQVMNEHVEAVPFSPTPSLIPHSIKQTQQSLFVPYWSLASNLPQTYTRYIYFGVSGTSSGLDTTDAGYKNIAQFVSLAKGKEQYLGIRMLDSQDNFLLLNDRQKQAVLISDTVALAQKYQFSGVVLDLEMSALPFDSLISQVTQFESMFAKKVKIADMHFATTVYGDTFYRIRPYDIKSLAATADELMVMAYDFHKARGNPGPNFPLTGASTYGYDLQKMSEDFLQVVPPEKLTVVFGMFGYDWAVDEKQIATEQAEAMSDVQIQQKFLIDCQQPDCKVQRDTQSAETHVSYTDTQNHVHSVWFEDEESVNKKKAYLQSQGIGSFSFWANSYF